jgi:hypothetical protein
MESMHAKLARFLPQAPAISKVSLLTMNYGAFYRGPMELGVQPAVANSALVPG